MRRIIFVLLTTLALSTAHADKPSIVINELMASNAGSVMSPAYNFDSWIELYNPTEQTINLAGYYLSDDASNLTRWQMPDDIGTIPAKGFLVVWLGSDDIKSNHAPFKLDCDGGIIYLSDKSGKLITSVNYPEALSRTAYARTIDGGDNWGWTTYPTPEATNATAIFATKRLDPPVVSEGSQILHGSLTVKVDIPEGTKLMYTTDCSIPSATEVTMDGPQEPYWKNWVRNSDCEGEDATSIVCRDGDGSGDIAHITDGVGYNGSRGAKVHSIENPANDWDTQFFVYTPDHIWSAGEKFHFSMKVKADKPGQIYAQSHRTPGDYIYWKILDGGYDITTNWETIDYEGIITEEQAGNGAMQTIAFNLNIDAQENNFYFDDIVWEQYVDPSTTTNGSSRQSKDGVFVVDKTTNYVFRLFKEGYLPSVPVTRSYIQTDNEYTIPIISIVGDERYFTDPMWGIDVKGTNGKTGNGSDDPVNWNMDWDRPVNFSYISPDNGMLFNQDVNIAVSGGWTRGASPRSMKLKSNKIFDGLNHFDYSFFPQKPYIRSKTLLVRNGGNDVWNNHARFMDPALTTIIQRSGIDVDVQSFVQVAEYINGRFKGILNLREPTNDKYVYANFGYDDEEIDMFENGTFKNGTNEAYNRLCQLAENSNDAETYKEMKRLLDIDEFANYMAVELFIGNDDWPENNVKAYRSQNDGRFRFICFDLDYTFNPWDRNSFTQVLDNNRSVKMVSLFINLLKNDEFRRKFIDTYCLVAGSVFEKNRAIGIVDELANAMRPMSEYDGYLPDNAANKIKDKLQTRLDDMMSRIQQYAPMKLTNVRQQSVTISSDTEGASLFVNGLEVPYSTFNGKLFAPVTLEAKAPVGYSFTGWRQSSGSTIQIIKTNDTWKYYDQGEPSSNWYSSNFNDASWPSGQAPLGYKMDGVKTTVSYGPDSQRKHPTTYFRKTLTLNAEPKVNDLFELNYQVDDGFIIWVNGQNAGRVNMRSGEVNFNTFSSTYAEDVPKAGTIYLPATLFKKGANVIAVEVHNTSYTSSDLFWACQLFTTVGTNTNETVLTDPVINLSESDNNLLLVASFKPLTDKERKEQGLTPVRINEVSAANDIYVNEYFKRNDWIELYNTTNAAINVEGMYLSDNLDKPKKYQIEKTDDNSTIIPAHGYLIIWCDKLEPLSQLHTSFKLDAEGGDILLTAADESWNDCLSYTFMKGDETVGRYPDGSSNVITMNVPTIAKPNIISSYAISVSQSELTGISDMAIDNTGDISIRYTADRLIVHCTTSVPFAKLNIYNLAGQSVDVQTIDLSSGYAELALDGLSSGCYIARLSDGNGHSTICKFIKK